VLIDGQGPDEVAGGYMYFIPASFREASLMEKVLGMPDLAATAWANRHILDQYPLHLIWERISGRAGTNRRIPLRREWAAGFVDERPLWAVPSDLNSTLRRAVTESSLPALLRYGDRANMAFGIENRCPYLDHRLVEYVTALPGR
jgi:asparagine synthetase B (glutamine-hydrolysing)